MVPAIETKFCCIFSENGREYLVQTIVTNFTFTYTEYLCHANNVQPRCMTYTQYSTRIQQHSEYSEIGCCNVPHYPAHTNPNTSMLITLSAVQKWLHRIGGNFSAANEIDLVAIRDYLTNLPNDPLSNHQAKRA